MNMSSPYAEPTMPGGNLLNARPLHLRIEKAVEAGASLLHASPALVRVAEGEAEPLPAMGRPGAGLRCVRRNEGGVRQLSLPVAADVEEVVAVRAIAVHED